MSEEINIDSEPELNERQKAFCKEWSWDYNGTRSYKKIYGVEDDNVAAVNASRLLSNAKIQAYLEYIKRNLAETSGISPIMVLNEYKKIAFSSIASMHNTWIERKDFELLTEDQKASIQEIETKTVRQVKKEYNEATEKWEPVDYDVEYIKIKLFDKLKGLENINKMLGFDAPNKVELSNPDGSLNQLPKVSLSVPDEILEMLKSKGKKS